MVICGSYMFEFSVSKDIEKKEKKKNNNNNNNNNNKRKIPIFLLAYFLTLIIK
jgi:hypothetical protein